MAAVFQHGFETLAKKLGASVVGEPKENESFIKSSSNDNEYSLQVTSKGLMVWSKAGNFAIFLPGKS